jgi:hypothetical protein
VPLRRSRGDRARDGSALAWPGPSTKLGTGGADGGPAPGLVEGPASSRPARRRQR